MNNAKATARVAGETATIGCYVCPASAAAANQISAAEAIALRAAHKTVAAKDGREIVDQNAADKAAADEAFAQMIAKRDTAVGVNAAAADNRMADAKAIPQNAATEETDQVAAHEGYYCGKDSY